ncbi:hypothetical protein GQR58_007434 [Nymphon striatum]|nr:hypothetical protein GQR58_007434 [Nymphon striatum]
MQEFNDLAYTTSEQHKDLTGARIERDVSDLLKISAKMTSCSPFSSNPALRNIVNGIGDDANMHEYDSVGKNLIVKMIGQPVFSFSFKRKDKAMTLGNSSGVKVSLDRTIDPSLLFQRFLVVSRTGNLSLEEVMRYELSPYPPSLFEDKNILRKADKPQLAQAIIAHCNKTPSCEAISDTIPQTEMYVLDGGALLHKHKWTRGDTYGKIVKAYADFTSKQYGSATVVFDGYLAGPSIQDSTHQRRGQATIHPIVNFTGETEFEGKKEEFLSRGSNKQHLISLISDELERVGCTVIQAEADAGVDIAKTAVNIASVHSTTLIGQDTDLLVLLLHYCEMEGKPLYFRSDKQPRGVPKVYNISWIKRLLGSGMCTQIVFLHAFTGCDSTSRVYGVGKKPAFEKLVKGDEVLQSSANAFTLRGRNHTDVENLGIQAMSVTFGGESTCSLATLRYRIFTKQIAAAKSFVTPERLPPTESATKFHCLRVYCQTMTWMGMESGIDPLDWVALVAVAESMGFRAPRRVDRANSRIVTINSFGLLMNWRTVMTIKCVNIPVH